MWVNLRANRRIKDSLEQVNHESAQVQQQRDSALKTLDQLVYQISDSMNEEFVSVDETHQQLLNIAIKGLDSAAHESSNSAPSAIKAQAHFRLAGIYYRQGELSEATDHLRDAKKINDAMLAKRPGDHEAELRDVRILWFLASLNEDLASDMNSETELKSERDDLSMQTRAVFYEACKKTDALVERNQLDKPLLIDAIFGLEHFSSLLLSTGDEAEASQCCHKLISYANLIAASTENSVVAISDDIMVFRIKSEALNRLAEFAWKKNDGIATGHYDLQAESLELLIEFLYGFNSRHYEEQSPEAEQSPPEWLDSSTEMLKSIHQPGYWGLLELARREAQLREYFAAIGDLDRAIQHGRRCCDTLDANLDLRVTRPEADNLPHDEHFRSSILAKSRLADILFKSGARQSASELIKNFRKSAAGLTTKERSREDITRWLAKIDFVESEIGRQK